MNDLYSSGKMKRSSLGGLGMSTGGAFREEMNVKLSHKTSGGTRAKENGF